MPNTRLEFISGDVVYDQLAPSQAARTNFTPGKANGNPQDMNWPTDFRIPTGTPAFAGEAAGPVLIKRIIVVKTGRNIVSDQTVLPPIAGTPETTTITDPAHFGAVVPTSTLTPTNTQEANGNQERQVNGSDDAAYPERPPFIWIQA
jgi:hypothetical protein